MGSRDSDIFQSIDKVKLQLFDGDERALNELIKILRSQHFLREVSFYKIKFTTIKDINLISEIMQLRKYGLVKISLKDCTLKEDLINNINS